MAFLEGDKYLEPPVGRQAILTPVYNGEYPTSKMTVTDVLGDTQYEWRNVRKTDISMKEVERDAAITELQNFWETRRDMYYKFRGGSMGLEHTTRIIGCRPGRYMDDEGKIRGYFLRLFLECDPELLPLLDPPLLPV